MTLTFEYLVYYDIFYPFLSNFLVLITKVRTIRPIQIISGLQVYVWKFWLSVEIKFNSKLIRE